MYFVPQIYQFRVVLERVSPLVWRRLLVRNDSSIADLHYAIQIAMGWLDDHLHRFLIYGKEYGVYQPGGIVFADDPERIKLCDFRFRLGEYFFYEYDFTSWWKHRIQLEKILELNPKRVYPLCIGGKRPVPSEDSGRPVFDHKFPIPQIGATSRNVLPCPTRA